MTHIIVYKRKTGALFTYTTVRTAKPIGLRETKCIVR